jgi:hypothetical protein
VSYVVEMGFDVRIDHTVEQNQDWVAGLEGAVIRRLKRPCVWAEVDALARQLLARNVLTYRAVGRINFKENSSVLTIDGNRFAMTASAGTVTGSGELTGIPWHWTFLRGEFKVASSGMRIVDYNFFADQAVMGHKDFYLKKDGSDERLLMQEDVVLHAVEKATFDAKRAELLKQ